MAGAQRGRERGARGGFLFRRQVARLDAGTAMDHQARRVLRQQHAAAPLTTQGEALDEAQDRQPDAGPRADGGVGGEQASARRSSRNSTPWNWTASTRRVNCRPSPRTPSRISAG